ncbi:diguanylate cyclase domain-containing protein [Edwardsiella piscicida]|uniref:diguanylate cyclase domain-containing protein n=1 Tax=Edwardsiella piscicida TaxID=1263550 RepID=UPI00370DBFB1
MTFTDRLTVHTPASGDDILVSFSNILLNVFSVNNSLVARIGGDEFLVIVKAVEGRAHIKKHICDIRVLVHAAFNNYMDVGFDFSLGYCEFKTSLEKTPAEVDRLMYKNKLEKKNNKDDKCTEKVNVVIGERYYFH